MSVRPGSRGTGPGKGRSRGAARAAAGRSFSATKRPARPGASGPATARTDTAATSSELRRGTRQIAPRAGQRRRAAAMVGSPLARQIVALGLALAAVALSLAYPLRGYVQQQAAERAAIAVQHGLEQQIEDLQAQANALEDPAYVRAEAKRRLQYVSPGDTVYVVKLPAGVAAAENPATDGTGTDKAATDKAATDNAAIDGAVTGATSAASDADQTESPDLPWYETLWGTLTGDTTGGDVQPGGDR